MNLIGMINRKSIRLKEYDYSSPGEYFVTICSYERKCIFGKLINEKMQLSEEGKIINEEWLRTAEIRPNITLDEFIIMPNHVHGIIIINEIDNVYCRGTLQRAPTVERFGKPTPNSIPTIIRLFKSITTKRINQIYKSNGVPVWQRDYYEHIVRSERDFNNIRDYIMDNPMKWFYDEENPISSYQSGR